MAYTILIVEDDPLLSEDLSLHLQSTSYDVIALVGTGEEAVQKAEETRPDLIIMDIKLSGEMDGIEAARLIRGRLDTAIVYLTEYADDSDVFERAKMTEPHGYVSKDATPVELENALEMALYKHQTERRLKESEKRYRSMLEQSPDGVGLNVGGRFAFANSALARILGAAIPDEIIGRQVLEFVHPEFHEVVKARIKRVMEGETVPAMEQKFVRIDGEVVDVEVAASGVAYGAEPAGQIVVRDVTERKNAEEALRKAHDELEHRIEERTAELRESNECLINEATDREKAERELRRQNDLFNGVLEALTHPFYVINSDDYTIEIANSAALASGISPSSTCYSVAHDREEPCSGPGLPCPLEEIKKTKQPVMVEHIHCEPDGSKRSVEVNAYPLLDREGSVKQVIEYWLDITERKRAQEAQRRLATVVEQSSEMIIITDPAGIVRYVNPAFEDGSGYTAEEVVGNKTKFCYAYECDEERWNQLLDTLQSGRVWKDRLAGERKDGTPYHEDVTIFPVRDASGEIVNFVAIKRDISHLVELEEQLIVAQKMEAVGTLAGGIAHDFNNLIQIIVGYGELLFTQMEKTDPGYNDLQIILKAGLRGAELVRSILTFSRQADSNPRPICLNNEVKQAHKLLERTLPKMIDIELRLADDLRRIDADPAQMERILVNLAVNSRDAMPDGGRLIIETENVFLDEDYLRRHLEVKPGHYVRLTVSDTGCGMERETVERIFDPFFTTKDIGQGTGLGLSTVFGIVKTHGGYITCYSETGVGTTFKLDFPALEIEIETEVTESAAMPAFGTETILVVDDEEHIRELAKRYLTRAGYTILMAGNGAEALEVYRENQPDISLVMLDLIMPQMGGKECLEELLRIDPKAKVLIASGFSPEGPARETIRAGVKGFVDKPFRAKEMLKTIRRVLDEG